MKIETKFNIGDEVWFIDENKVCCDKIAAIHIHLYESEQYINYSFGLNNSSKAYTQLDDGKFFRTKQELLDSL